MQMDESTSGSRSWILAALLLALVGCNPDSPKGQKDGNAPAAELPAGVLLTEAPKGAAAVTDLKKTAKEGDEVVLRVVIGGRVKPFVEKRAVMTVVDASFENACTKPDDACPTKWDYCCASPEALQANSATLQIVDDKGQPLAIDLNGVAKLKPLSVIVVKGKVGPRPDPGTLLVSAASLFVESNP